jgi:hypothetical protein
VEPDTGNRAPWLRVDADGVAHVLGPEIASERFWQGVVPGDWFAFMEEASIATDGWLNAATGELLRVPQPPAGMQPFGLDHCNSSAQLRDDGRVIAGLRDDVAGGAFLANDDGSFTRIGSPIRGALFVEIRLLGETVVLSAIDHQYRYCPPAIWTTAEPAGPLLRAGQSELLRAGRSLVIEDPHGFGVELDPSGRYAPVVSEAGTVLHDLELGTAEALPAGTRMIGWLML